MTKSHLPISAYARLETLRRLKVLREAKGLSDGQDAAADVVFASKGPGGLNRLRGQAIAELVASGYLLEEIMMVLADPESPYSILIEGLKPESIHDTIRAIVRDTKAARKKQGETAARSDYVQHLHRLRDAAWAALDESGVSHTKNLLDSIEKYGQAIAEAENIRIVRAGRGSTKQTEPEEQSEDEEETPAGDTDNPKWEEEYPTDEDHD
jgi:hypothetical protein